MERQQEFFSLLQERYATLVRSEDVSPIEVLQAIEATMAAHPLLASSAVPY